jgi:ribonucleoside-diphosphate reductase alpha subunit
MSTSSRACAVHAEESTRVHTTSPATKTETKTEATQEHGPPKILIDDGTSQTPFDAERLSESIVAHTVLQIEQARVVVADIAKNLPPIVSHKKLDEVLMLRLSNTVDCDYQDAAGQYDYEMLRRTLPVDYVQVCRRIRDNTVRANGNSDTPAPRLSAKFMDFVQEHGAFLQAQLDAMLASPERRTYSFFAMATFRRTYLLRVWNHVTGEDETAELPEHMYLREAIQVTRYDLARIPETFRLLAFQFYTHASPTMFNAGAPVPQMASCFLLEMGDSIDSIFDTIKKCADISKTGGGIGLNMQQVRSIGTPIKSGGESNGICPLLRVVEATTDYVSQGNKRRGSCAVYAEVWNKQVFDLCELRLPTGGEVNRCRNLFTAFLLNDIFMERFAADARFTLFCVTDVPDLPGLYGPAFTRRYIEYESEIEKYNGRSVRARSVLEAICKSMQTTGTPYLLSKSHLNKSQHTGMFGPRSTVRTSNLCGEIAQYTDPDHTAVCNLATAILVRFVKTGADGAPYFDWDAFRHVVRVMTRNLDNTLDDSYYPTPCTKRMNLCCRPLGMGIQGLSNTFMAMGMPFDSPEALALDRDIAEVMYFEALSESCTLAAERGAYPRYEHSPMAKHGTLQFDFYGAAQKVYGTSRQVGKDNWMALRARIATTGVRNSLLIAHPPTASTASVTGCTECFELPYRNLQARKVSAGIFLQLLRELFDWLKAHGRWNEDVKQLLIKDWGSLDRIPMPAAVKALFVSAMEMKQRVCVDHMAERIWFIDQSASMSGFWIDPAYKKLVSHIMYGYRKGLKTLCYYTRRRPKAETHQFSAISDRLAGEIAARLRSYYGDGELATDEAPDRAPYVPVLDLGAEATHLGGGGGGGKAQSAAPSVFVDLGEPEECVMCGS